MDKKILHLQIRLNPPSIKHKRCGPLLTLLCHVYWYKRFNILIDSYRTMIHIYCQQRGHPISCLLGMKRQANPDP